MDETALCLCFCECATHSGGALGGAVGFCGHQEQVVAVRCRGHKLKSSRQTSACRAKRVRALCAARTHTLSFCALCACLWQCFTFIVLCALCATLHQAVRANDFHTTNTHSAKSSALLGCFALLCLCVCSFNRSFTLVCVCAFVQSFALVHSLVCLFVRSFISLHFTSLFTLHSSLVLLWLFFSPFFLRFQSQVKSSFLAKLTLCPL